jgi:hypothetical protein
MEAQDVAVRMWRVVAMRQVTQVLEGGEEEVVLLLLKPIQVAAAALVHLLKF